MNHPPGVCFESLHCSQKPRQTTSQGSSRGSGNFQTAGAEQATEGQQVGMGC